MTDRDLADLQRLRGSTRHLTALADLTSMETSGSVSEALLLRALVEAGLRAVKERVEVEGYAELARDTADLDESRAIARRRPLRDDE